MKKFTLLFFMALLLTVFAKAGQKPSQQPNTMQIYKMALLNGGYQPTQEGSAICFKVDGESYFLQALSPKSIKIFKWRDGDTTVDYSNHIKAAMKVTDSIPCVKVMSLKKDDSWSEFSSKYMNTQTESDTNSLVVIFEVNNFILRQADFLEILRMSVDKIKKTQAYFNMELHS